ncbi:MAG: hypothetical protein QG602_2465 [Verrucomicrobiota bacterium]|nr:hypothetical protein [Verrucomicrobiota bacterium]
MKEIPIHIDKDVAAIFASAPRFQEIPPPAVAALRVAKIEGPYPKKAVYDYDKFWKITLENGAWVMISNDRVANMCHAKVGGYYTFSDSGSAWFYDEATFKAKFLAI